MNAVAAPFKLIAVLWLMACCHRSVHADVVNGGFEASPFLTGWTNSGVTAIAGLNGSAAAARLPFSTTATLGQTVAALSNFTFDTYLQSAGITESQSFRFLLDSSVGNAIEVRGAVGNAIQVNHGGQYLYVTSLSGGANFTFAANSTIRFRVIGRNFGMASAEYDLAWSNAGSTTLVHAATGLKSFVNGAAAITGSGINQVRFDRNLASAHSHSIDDVSLVSGASAPPTADYQVLLPVPPSGPVSLPYIASFTTDQGAFTTTTPATWTVTGGAYRNTISTNNTTNSASIQTLELGGDALTAPDFFLSSKFNLISNTSTANAVGFALFGTNSTFSGGLANPYYIIDFRPSAKVVRCLRVGINDTAFLPDTTLSGLTLNTALPFSLEVTGRYENGVLTMAITVRQGASSDTVYATDSEPLSIGNFGYRNRTGAGTLSVDCDDFTLRHLSTISFASVPAPFARAGVPYSATVAGVSDIGANVSLSAPTLPSWLSFEPNTLTGTPTAGNVGIHAVTIAAVDDEDGALQQTFHVSVLEPTGVIISEFLAENETGLRDEDGEQGDWIELFNTDATAASVEGMFLSDDPLQPMKWAIPAGSTIPPYGFLVIYASAKNRTANIAALHTNFKLTNSANGYVSLAQANGVVISSYQNYPAQRADRSYGAFGNYTSRGFLLNPTPGAPNDPVGYVGFVADTVFSVKRGFYTAPQNVVITCATAGATIVYTTDGSTPSLTNGAQSPSPLNLNIASSTTLRASAFAPNLAPSGPDTQTYLFLEDIRTQSASGAAPAGWPTGRVNGQVFDYGMDPDITNTVTPQAMKDALASLPTLSIVTDLPNLVDPATGIYTNPYGREEGYECPISFELINPDNSPGFQVNAGLRIRGGASRVATNPKHNFHVYFRSQYGASKLRFPLFGDEGADEFDRVDLRTTQVTSWHKDGSAAATYNRDEFCRYSHAAMGQPYTRSRYYHLYINGQYWGTYGTQERADSDFAASYFGGDKEDYDVMKTYVIPHRVAAADGDDVAWGQLHAAATAGFASDAAYYAVQGLDASGQPSATVPLVDVDSVIDYTLLHYYSGDDDAPINVGVGVPKNFYAIRARDGRFGFRFFTHDAESCMVDGRNVTGDTTVGATLSYFNPRWLSQRLAMNAKYRLRFADRVQKHFFNGGAMDNPMALNRWVGIRNSISSAMLAESARWGDAASVTPRTVTDWANANDTIQNGFLVTRRDVLITQLRGLSLFSSFDAPSFNQTGGNVASGFNLTITAPANTTIFYTTNGIDPMEPGALTYSGAVPLTGTQITVKARARLNTTSEWSALTESIFTVDASPAVAGKLAISEIHYNSPGTADDLEFVELLNVSNGRLDLTGVNFTKAMIFTFGNVVLEPGQRILVVEDEAAFTAALGTTLLIGGQWIGALKNSTDTILLRDKNGVEIESVTYSDQPPWPVAADGEGSSLVRINPLTSANTPLNWRPSVGLNGNPGATDATALATWLAGRGYASALDSGPSGVTALIEYATGLDLSGHAVPALTLIPETGTDPATATLSFRHRLSADDATLTVELSPGLSGWQSHVPGSLTTPIVARQSHGDGTETLTLRVPSTDRMFVRLRATTP